MKAVRWGDNDRYLGPFTWHADDWKKWSVVLKSRGDDDHESGICSLRISAYSYTLIAALPNIVKPHMEKVYPSWDAATVERLGRDWYWSIDPRQYGFSCSDGHFNVYYGRTGGSMCDSRIEQRWSCFLPWTQWRHVRHSFYGLLGERLYDEPQGRWGKLGDKEWREHWDARQAREDAVPTVTFAFKDFDGEDLTAITKIEEREWRFGAGYFKWLSLFRRPKISRSLDIRFSGETGKRKGSWKGGTVGHSIEMLPSELHESAFRRYCQEHDMKFIEASKGIGGVS
jgi:hypothetical protein